MRPIFNKKVARVHCSRKTWSTTAAREKKNRKKENAERGNVDAQTCNPNQTFVCVYVCFSKRRPHLSLVLG